MKCALLQISSHRIYSSFDLRRESQNYINRLHTGICGIPVDNKQKGSIGATEIKCFSEVFTKFYNSYNTKYALCQAEQAKEEGQ